MSFVLQFLGALIILGVLIFVHELGHFAMAKALGFRVDEFSMGFGPKVFARARKDTVYSLRALPLGGFCRFHMEEEGGTEENGDYAAQKPWKRFLVTLAGPFMNILLAFVLAVISLLAWGDTACVISAVNAGSPAQQAGLLPGDMIVAVAGEDLAFDFAALENVQQADPSEGVELTVVRNGERLIVTVSGLTADAETGRLMMGVTLDYSARRSFGFGEALTSAFDYLGYLIRTLVEFLFSIFSAPNLSEQLSGPVGTVGVIMQAVSYGWLSIFRLCIFMCINLGVLNLIPFPGLDGGRLVFILIEMIFKKPVPRDKEGLIHLIGMGLLLLLILYLTIGEIF